MIIAIFLLIATSIGILRRLAELQSRRRCRRCLLVTAHPDDESLFFANYVDAAVRAGAAVHVLCLSTGNANGLGPLREMELRSACSALKIPDSHITILDDPALQDGFHPWEAAPVVARLTATLASVQPDELVTFDAGGVSGHPNHTSIFRAVKGMLEAQGAEPAPDVGVRHCRVLTLVTHSLLYKFSGPMGAALTPLLGLRAGDEVAIAPGPLAGVRAMCRHRSQLVWYRWLFMAFSTYTYVNQLRPLGVMRY
ncbi:hypothetical protein HYH03_006812 [Edaphochlamys debaryana]|uniref:N-acetylglucosaminylphosphatidylinositol deacetylase n=1 Tax=Edaphochlamys debaryana TaxID=47281 RepID=A0A836BZX3_9CHLO|nr:hypothetical protein HYH03_006812 [Edaphochlamys debaryana]|eukprot:KAG2495206.1 hypothetical protein HYH03_006812 [Edaphochlamys debaryana]